ncbi:MAG TPA: SIMPL domain-containing protein [Methylomirabilota bacterium]|nr:SIMPL domain-containing protein [Methylomirabilota bacterium]
MQSFFRAAAFAVVLALGSSPVLADDAPRIPTLSLSATGVVTAPPDTAVVTVGVVTEAETAGPALTENNERMRALIDAVKEAGVADRDIGTSGFRIDPVMSYPDGDDGDEDTPRITGYRVENNVTVKIREIAKAGDLLDGVVRIGANQVTGIAFTIENDRELLDRARADAVQVAEAKAGIYADAGKFNLGRMLSLTETMDIPSPRGDFAMARMEADIVPIAPGEQELSVTIQVEWEIQRRP